jgi:hypothetical protein
VQVADGRLPLTGWVLGQVPPDAAAGHAAALLRALGAGSAGDGPAIQVAAAEDSGPVADWAASGAMALTGPPTGPPLVAPGRPATAARGAALALDALVGRSLGVAGHLLLGERAALLGFTRRAPWSAGGSCRPVATRDGWVALSLAREDDRASVPALVQAEAPGEPWQLVERWARERSSDEVAERAQLLGMAAAPVPDTVLPAWPPWRISSYGGVVCCYGGTVAPRRPFVLDLSALWAGPLCAALLGLAGAEVVRVESTGRPDGGRRGSPEFDDLLHAGQPSVALPFHEPHGRAQLRDLVARADVVVTSARPRALEQLGLDPAAYLAGRSQGVWVAVTAHPPRPDGTVWAGFGDDAAMSVGLVCRDPDGTPLPCGDALADPLTGLHAAVAAQAALRSGGRHLVQVALSEVAASTLDRAPVPSAVEAHPGWQVAGEHGAVAVADPTARRRSGSARPLGADTGAVLRRE